MAEIQFVKNPESGKQIKVDGATFKQLIQMGYTLQDGILVKGEEPESKKIILVMTEAKFNKLNKIYLSHLKNAASNREKYRAYKKKTGAVSTEKDELDSLESYIQKDPLNMTEMSASIKELGS